MTSFLRSVLFWLHLATGVTAGAIVLIMSVTGVVLTYERQMLEWADRRSWSAPPSPGTTSLPPETLLARVREAQPEAIPTALTLRSDPAAPATVALDGAAAVLVDPYRGTVIGSTSTALRAFFRAVTSWHRWLAMEGESRALGKGITGAANLAFLFIVLSGMYLWVPRIWNRAQVRNVLWFRRGVRGKARDFNWHNAIGIWSAVPLAIVVAGAVPISYPWASNLVYRAVGEEPPRSAQVARSPSADAEAEVSIDLTGLDAGFRAAVAQIPGWRTISVRIPTRFQKTLVLTVDEGYGGQPQMRGTLTVNRRGAVERWETFSDLSVGRRLRSWLRFAHTGEYYGLVGQTLAGAVSLGGVVLVWTGIALACRRFVAWRQRRRHVESEVRKAA